VMAGSLTEIAARLAAEKPPGPCLILYGAALAGVGHDKAGHLPKSDEKPAD
jgi:uroporphyrin-III C-methyltransferase